MSNLLDRQAEDGSELVGGCPTEIRQIDFVVTAGVAQIGRIAVGGEELFHQGYCPGLAVEGADMQTLHAQTLLQTEKLCRTNIQMLFAGNFSKSPLKIFCSDKIREPKHTNPSERGFDGNAV